MTDPVVDGRRLLHRSLLVWPLAWALIALLHWRHADFPWYWDGLGYVFPHSWEIWQSGLFPILRNWDVGHPTLYYWLVALGFTIIGPIPLAGHLVCWAFAGLLAVGTWVSGRLMGLGRGAAAMAVLVLFCFPIMRSNLLLTNLDLALAALTVLAYAAWSVESRWLYIMAAAAAALTKIYGILVIVPPVLLVLAQCRRWPAPGWGWRLATALGTAVAPLLVLGAFLAVRHAVRGGGLTVGWTTGNQLVPFWMWSEFLPYIPRALAELWRASLMEGLVYTAVVLAPLAAWSRHRRGGAMLPAIGPGFDLFVLNGLLLLMLTGMFVQLYSLSARYLMPGLPLLVLVPLVLAREILGAGPRGRIVWYAGAVALALLFSAWQHPDRGRRWPAMLHAISVRSAEPQGYRHEHDLRMRDIVRVVRWAAETIHADAASRGRAPEVVTCWPFTVAMSSREAGWVSEPMPAQPANSWREAGAARPVYLVLVEPVCWFQDEEERDPRWAPLASRSRGEARARVYTLVE